VIELNFEIGRDYDASRFLIGLGNHNIAQAVANRVLEIGCRADFHFVSLVICHLSLPSVMVGQLADSVIAI